MESVSVPGLVEHLLSQARSSRSGRAAQTIYGGHDRQLRQTMLAFVAEQELAEHDSPGEATLQVLHGRIRLVAGDQPWEGGAGELVAIPPIRHALAALEDSAVLLTVRVAR